MRLIKTIAVLAAVLAYHTLTAQSVFYQFSKSTATYVPLTSPTVLTTTLINNYETMPVPGGFKTFNVSLPTSFKVGSNGWIVGTGPTNSFAYNPYLLALTATPTSSVSYKLEATASDSILKIEWKDVAPATAPSGEKLSFQLWFYKKSQAIEFHYGPSNMSTPTSPAMQIAFLSADFTQAYEQHSLYGYSTIVKDSLTSDTSVLHDGVPLANTVYRFSNPSTSISETNKTAINVFPNPAGDILYVDSKQELSFTLADITGKQVMQGHCSVAKSIDTHALYQGHYILSISDGEHTVLKQVQIVH